jgi:hypothetical protein
LADILCIEEERVVARDNTIAHEGRQLQLPQSPVRAHYVKARVKVREYPDGTLAVFHGPRRIARYSAQGVEIAEVPTARSRDAVLAAVKAWPGNGGERAAAAQRRPALTASARATEIFQIRSPASSSPKLFVYSL